MRRVPLWLVGWTIVVAELVIMLWLGWLYSRHGIVISVEKGADIATLVLTAAILVVTGVAVAIGVVTIWGFREILERVTVAAQEAARTAALAEIRRAYGQGAQSPTVDDADRIAETIDQPP
jgi:hypothetical protein